MLMSMKLTEKNITIHKHLHMKNMKNEYSISFLLITQENVRNITSFEPLFHNDVLILKTYNKTKYPQFCTTEEKNTLCIDKVQALWKCMCHFMFSNLEVPTVVFI